MKTDQETRGFLPPTITTPTGFTALPLPQSPKTTSCTTQDSELSAVINRAIFKIHEAVTAGNTHNPIRRTKSEAISSTYRKQSTRKTPLRRTVSDAVTSSLEGSRKVGTSLSSRNKVPESLNRDESPQVKRLKKMEEMVMEMEQWCRDLRGESEVQENVGDDKPSEAIVDEDEGREGFKRIDEGEEERIGFSRLDDGALRIQMRCPCRKHFEILHNHIGCFYRLI